MVRLQGGSYSNEGRVEVYCNGQWGAVCSDGFGYNDALTICKQLGYSNYMTYSYVSLLVITLGLIILFFQCRSTSRNVWMTNLPCTSTTSCIQSCQNCSKTPVTNCNNEVSVQCSKKLLLRIFYVHVHVR